MKLNFATLDVFTTKRFAGNSLGVVFDADGIDGATMQVVAREFNHPETVFVLKPKAAGSTAGARIFTPNREMPFAGHPTVGTALVLTLRRGAGNDVVLEEKIGPVQCRVVPEGSDHGRSSFILPAMPSEAGAAAGREAIAAALGLAADDIGFDGHQPSRWSAGNAFTFVPLRSIEAVRRCQIVDVCWSAGFETNGPAGAFVFCRQTEDKGNDFHARMFAPSFGVREDPATGSAAAAFAGFCAKSLSLGIGEHRFVIELGVTMQDGMLASATVGGPAIIVTEGTIEV